MHFRPLAPCPTFPLGLWSNLNRPARAAEAFSIPLSFGASAPGKELDMCQGAYTRSSANVLGDFSLEIVGQRLSQQQPRPVQARLGRADRDPEDCGDLLMAYILDLG
jgi:hypothetical protein